MLSAQPYIAQERNVPAVRAFLDVIACLEGTYDSGYNIKFGGSRFSRYHDHPRQRLCYTVKGVHVCSSAAGRYQLDSQEWESIRKQIRASQFTPMQQDYAMVYLLRSSGALEHVKLYEFKQALHALRSYKNSVAQLLDGRIRHCSVDGLYATFIAHVRYYTAGTWHDALEAYLKRPEVRAFLDTIAYAEGTATSDGYYICFPGRRCALLKEHPATVACATSRGNRICSSAAGRYQMLKDTWRIIAWRIAARDFSAHEQDRAAVQMLLDRGIISLLLRDKVTQAIYAAGKGWASLPGSPHGQPRYACDHIRRVFNDKLHLYQKNFLKQKV